MKKIIYNFKVLKDFIIALATFASMVKKIGGNVFSYFPHLFRYLKDRKTYNIKMIDYFELTYYKKTKAEKEEYLNSNEQRDFAYAIDDVKCGIDFTVKSTLYSLFKKQMGRSQLFTGSMTKDDFLNFVKENNIFMFKPDYSWCGEGIRKIDVNNYADLHTLYDELKCEVGVLDEIIVQHSEMCKLNPDTLNSIRIFSIRINNEIRILAAALRIGRKNVVIDNYSAGGIVCSIDINTGKTIDLGEDMFGKRYEKHPDSNVELVGFKIPNWDKAIELVTEAAMISPINYVGWDIAILENGCLLIEGNFNPMLNVVQIAGGGGKKKAFEKILQEYKETQKIQEIKQSTV